MTEHSTIRAIISECSGQGIALLGLGSNGLLKGGVFAILLRRRIPVILRCLNEFDRSFFSECLVHGITGGDVASPLREEGN
jgi:hypothetical protein